MKNKREKQLYLKLVILLICIIIVLRIFILALAKYETISNFNANVDVAFYLLKEDYQTMTTNLTKISPRDNAYIFNFSVGNQDGTKVAETDLIYNLTLRTTTNLPLTYELYMNETYDSPGASSIILQNEVKKDDFGTYFRTMTTAPVSLPYTTGVTNLYQLVIHFPSNYKQAKYQDIIEMLEIIVESKQVISTV